MTDASTQADAWLDRSRARLGTATLGPRAEQIGRVEEVGDGMALVSGLPDVRLDELLRFDRGQFGFAQVLERDRVGCVLFDDVDAIQAGDTVRGTGDVVRVPVGPGLLGRVVDPLGRPLDGKGPIVAETLEPIERPAPAIIDRDLVTQPVQTGLVVVDTLFALGRGQRELIIGDRASARPRSPSTRSSTRKTATSSASISRSARKARASGAPSMRSMARVRPSAASSSWPVPRARPDCNGSPPSRASPWRNISATAANMRWS